MSAPPTVPTAPEDSAGRLQSIDLLRGLVMILMVLDHTRGLFSKEPFSPVDLARTFPALFATRWITYLCAPAFVFLAGASAYLHGARGLTRGQLSRFLLTRGLWLLFLEMTYLNWLVWSDFLSGRFLAVIFWAIGWSMICLAGLVWLPRWVIAAVGLVLCAGHNLLDNVAPESWGPWGWLWQFLHAGGRIEISSNIHLDIMYRLVPWNGLMAIGYACGPAFQWEPARRRRWAWRAGLVLLALFLAVRFVNQYGDPTPWAPGKNAVFTVMSFVNCNKYPPSLDFLLMMMGPILLLLAALEREAPAWMGPVRTFGRVPMFFFLLHLPLIRLGAAVTKSFRPPPRTGFGLLGVYMAWIVFVLLLYYPCRSFAALKRRNKSPWLSYF